MRQGSSVLGRYGYDSVGLRILKIGDDGFRRYTYDDLSVVTEADQLNATVTKYDYGLDQLVSLDNVVDGRSFFHLDVLRSTANATGASGEIRQSILYDAWGNERDRIGLSPNKFTYTGHEKDSETSLIYAKARFYDAGVGRFLSQDSMLGDTDSPPSLHRFTYVHSNPASLIDPSGLAAVLSQRIDELREELEQYRPYENKTPGEGFRLVPLLPHPDHPEIIDYFPHRPSEILSALVRRAGSKERAFELLDELQAAGNDRFAIIVLEDDDFSHGQLLKRDVFLDFLQEVGGFAAALEGLEEQLFSDSDVHNTESFRDISTTFNLAFDFSSAAAFALAKRDSSSIPIVEIFQQKALWSA